MPRPIGRDAFLTLSKVVAGFVSTKRPVWQSEVKHIQTYLQGFGQDDTVVRSVLLASLQDRRQLQGLSPQLSLLKAEFSEDEKEEFWASVYRLCLSFPDTRNQVKPHVVSIGYFIGISGAKLAMLASSIEAESIPRLMP